MPIASKRYLIDVRGELACFTDVCKVERNSYPVITPSAARGILDSILWKPAIRWFIDRIIICNPVKYITIRRNELKGRPNAIGEADRDLRLTRALRDVRYIIEAHFEMTDLAGENDNLNKFDAMFTRRLYSGQFFREPFLGCREFPALVSSFDGDPSQEACKAVDLEVGTMVWDFESRQTNNYLMFHADIRQGELIVPHRNDFVTPEATC